MFKLEKLTDKAVLTIYGYVGGYYMDFRSVNAALEEIVKAGYKKMDYHVHTYGGDVFEGNLMQNFFASFPGEIDVYIDGVCASMGPLTIIDSARIHIAENGFIMIHAPQGGARGTSKQMAQTAKLLNSMEKNFVAKLVARTGKPEAEVKQWMDGTDYWFDADDAIATGLADDKFSSKIQLPALATTEAAQLGAEAVYNRFVALNQEIPTIKTNMKKDLIARYGLTTVTEASTEEEVMAAIDAKMKATGTDAEARAQAAAKAAIETVVDGAVAAGKIPATKRDEYVARGEKMGIADMQAIIADMQVYQPISGQIKGGTAGATAEERKGWTWNDYQTKAIAELEAMPKSNPELFKALYKAEYKCEPEL